MAVSNTREFRKQAPRYIAALMKDFGFTDFQAAGFPGNAGLESAGFTIRQEVKPTSGRGGLGPFQWTGPRRKNYEAWLMRKGAEPFDFESDYGFLYRELKGPEKKVVSALRKATTVDEATEIVMRVYERPGVLHLSRRQEWGRLALSVYRDGTIPVMDAQPAVVATPPVVVSPAAPPAAGLWDRLKLIFNRKAELPAIKVTKGDPQIYAVQEQLKAKGYYSTGELDGVDGRKTRDSIASIRKDNGMGDGGIDAAFLAALPGFPQMPVSVERATGSLARASAARPEVFEAPKTLTIGGISVGGLGALMGLGGDTLSGWKDTADKVSGTVDTVQEIARPVLAVASFCLTHPWLVICAVGLYFTVKGLLPLATLILQWRQGRL